MRHPHAAEAPDPSPGRAHHAAGAQHEPAPVDPARAQAIARDVGRIMLADDRAAVAAGIELLEIGPGHARMQMRVRPEFTNGHRIAHGGYIFLLADTTFAYACNSHNQRAVAASAAIEFLAPAHEGDLLTAEGREQHLSGRSGVCDIRVTDPHGRLIALFRGRSTKIRGHFVEEAT